MDLRAKFCKARSAPFAIKGAIEGEPNRLEAAGIVERVTHGDRAAPIVAVPKKDGGFRISGDYKVTHGKWISGCLPVSPSKPQWIVCYTCWWQDIY